MTTAPPSAPRQERARSPGQPRRAGDGGRTSAADRSAVACQGTRPACTLPPPQPTGADARPHRTI